MTNIDDKLNNIIRSYDMIVGGMDESARTSVDRAYGGVLRATKGTLVESIATELVKIAWVDLLGQSLSRIKINKQKMPISISDEYIQRPSNIPIKDYLTKNRTHLVYKFGTDVQVFIDGKLVVPIECKAYTENAMIKRILFDALLMKEAVGTDTYYLLQLESQLGGDYSQLNDITYGSPATHALLSHIPVDLQIITLLKGERNINEPIHKPQYYKALDIEQLRKAVKLFASAMEPYKK